MKSRLFSFLLIWAFVPLASAQEASPDVLIKGLSEDVIAAIRQDKDIQAGDADKISALVEAKILPHFDFRRTTQVAMGVNWRRASADQQERLTSEFRLLLVRTYSGALASYRDQIIELKPLRASPGDSEVTVRSQVKQSGAEPITIDYAMEKTASGWKIFDVSIGGISLAANYRTAFGEEGVNIISAAVGAEQSGDRAVMALTTDAPVQQATIDKILELEGFDGLVVGAADAVRGEVPVAYVVLRRPVAADELERRCRARLASFIGGHMIKRACGATTTPGRCAPPRR